MDELPSSVAVAPPGLLVNITSCGAPVRTGGGRRSIFGNSVGGAAAFTASGSDLAGGSGCSDLAGEATCPTSGARFSPSRRPPASGRLPPPPPCLGRRPQRAHPGPQG